MPRKQSSAKSAAAAAAAGATQRTPAAVPAPPAAAVANAVEDTAPTSTAEPGVATPASRSSRKRKRRSHKIRTAADSPADAVASLTTVASQGQPHDPANPDSMLSGITALVAAVTPDGPASFWERYKDNRATSQIAWIESWTSPQLIAYAAKMMPPAEPTSARGMVTKFISDGGIALTNAHAEQPPGLQRIEGGDMATFHQFCSDRRGPEAYLMMAAYAIVLNFPTTANVPFSLQLSVTSPETTIEARIAAIFMQVTSVSLLSRWNGETRSPSFLGVMASIAADPMTPAECARLDRYEESAMTTERSSEAKMNRARKDAIQALARERAREAAKTEAASLVTMLAQLPNMCSPTLPHAWLSSTSERDTVLRALIGADIASCTVDDLRARCQTAADILHLCACYDDNDDVPALFHAVGALIRQAKCVIQPAATPRDIQISKTLQAACTHAEKLFTGNGQLRTPHGTVDSQLCLNTAESLEAPVICAAIAQGWQPGPDGGQDVGATEATTLILKIGVMRRPLSSYRSMPVKVFIDAVVRLAQTA